MDLHLHTPASADYQEPRVTSLQILQQAETKGLDIIAFTDHNSVRGYAEMWREIEDLELLEHLNRLQPAETQRLTEYRRLLGKVLVLPGFEFTATFGFHILAIFPEGTSIRLMEHLLMLLNVSEDRFGSGEVGATTDVLKTYETLADHGALVIGAHVNSTHGVAMQGLRFGGQTKIAYTQDAHLHALEVTDLALGDHRRSTARFFSGGKSEYSRRMHCIQGSDAHRLVRDPARDTQLGIGDRATEVLLTDVSFAAVKALFASDDFDRTRPFVDRSEVVEHVLRARSEGNSQGHAFHESYTTKRAGTSTIVKEIVGMANADGGTIYVGASPFEKRPIAGIEDEVAAIAELERDIAAKVVPALDVVFASFTLDQKTLLSITVLPGPDRPYAYGSDAILVRVNGETTSASRDQIVGMVRAAAEQRASSPDASLPPLPVVVPAASASETGSGPAGDAGDAPARRGRPVPTTNRQTGRPARDNGVPAAAAPART
ncbi:MAG: putative DNA binding domain-containing protein, partial [Chloroflexota bacterium]|nr:putative DNA binding domain-containing protein [Chloroflexota bacterium]